MRILRRHVSSGRNCVSPAVPCQRKAFGLSPPDWKGCAAAWENWEIHTRLLPHKFLGLGAVAPQPDLNLLYLNSWKTQIFCSPTKHTP